MLAIGTDSEYYNAVWVKNEWSRYLSFMRNDRSKILVIEILILMICLLNLRICKDKIWVSLDLFRT